MNRAALLQEFVTASADPVVWSVSDCTAWARAWVKRATGIDVPVLPYANRDDAMALIAREGGLPAIWGRALGEAGLFETDQPQLGDIGLVDTRIAGPIGVIFAQGGCALRRRDDGGVFTFATAHRALIKAWAI